MVAHVDHTPSLIETDSHDWSITYAATLREQLTEIAPELAVAIASEPIGLTITGTGWAIHAVRSDPHSERYLSLMAMRGMDNCCFEMAIRDLCLAMDANQRHQSKEPTIAE
ncbi:MAG: hypothetical protein ACJ789_01400 [Thermomicrobiales bacterium]